jgi:hypothetical protein
LEQTCRRKGAHKTGTICNSAQKRRDLGPTSRTDLTGLSASRRHISAKISYQDSKPIQ